MKKMFLVVSAVVLVLGGCAGSRLDYFENSGQGVERSSWWDGEIAPQEIVVKLPADPEVRWSYVGQVVSGSVPVAGQRFRSIASPRIALDYSAYQVKNPGYAPDVYIPEPPYKPDGVVASPATGTGSWEMMVGGLKMEFAGSKTRNRINDIILAPLPRPSLQQVLDAEPSERFVLDEAPESFVLTEDGVLVYRYRYRVAEREGQRFIADHTCTGRTYKPVLKRILQNQEGAEFMTRVAGAVQEVCIEAAKRDLMRFEG